MKRLIWLLVLSAALVVAVVPEASAHPSHYQFDRHYVVRHGHSYPYWLRRNSDFHDWYWQSRFRNDFYLSWNEIFGIYRYERRYRRPYPGIGHRRRPAEHAHRRHH